MKIRLTRKAKQLASALLVSLVICSILSLFVMYYLSLIEQQNILNARSQTWNMAIAISEAGIEEGLQQLNSSYPNMAGDGWTFDGSTCFYKTNVFSDGNSYTSYIYITNASNPTVVARAYVSPPNATYWQTTAMILFAAQGQTADAGQTAVTRAVQVTCQKTSPFNGAMIARKNIDLNGNNVSTDSFDSSNPAKSNAGQYDPSPTGYHGDKGDIATNLGVIDSIKGGNANIYGHAHTGPGSPSTSVQVGPNGYIGSHADQATVVRGVDPGWWLDDANFDFPVTTYPDTSSYLTATNGWVTNMVTLVATNYTTSTTLPLPVPAGIVTNTTYFTGLTVPPQQGTYTSYSSYRHDGNTYYSAYLINGYTWPTYTTSTVAVGTFYDHILWGNAGYTNYYVASDLSGSTIVQGPNVVLALPNGLNMSGSDAFTIGTGGNVIVYSGGTSAAINGNGFINTPGYASDFLLYCAPTVTSFSLSGNGTFVGVVVAPSVDVTLNGGGTTPTDFVGCLMANSVTLNGKFNFHYDEALGGAAGFGRFLITSWNEIK